MQTDQAILYSIWAADNAVYGPVELPTLIAWVKDERVVAETWVFDSQNDRWRKAASLPELHSFSARKPARLPPTRPSTKPSSPPACCAGSKPWPI